TSALGGTLLPTTAIVVAIIYATGAYPLFFLPIIQAVAGIMILISSAAMRYSARTTMRQEANGVLRPYTRGFYQGQYYGPQHGWQQPMQPYQPQYPPAQPAAPLVQRPAIPDSAFLSSMQEIAYEANKAPAAGRQVPESVENPAPPKSRGFCGLCGHPLPDISDLLFCPECGNKIGS
ncbi:MAG: zinc ribbon domain-containing protein, partial [Candidatus Lokiarchaeota archaeon]|nr:zinc ribbon domain-containing protein [Candidatus Lokiarchaeota archaeon]